MSRSAVLVLAVGVLVAFVAFVAGCRAGPEPSPGPQASTTASASASASEADASLVVPGADAATSTPNLSGEHDGAGTATRLVLARGARVVVAARSKIIAERSTPQGALVLGAAQDDAGSKLTATISPFLGARGLLDVAVTARREDGWHYESRETHYVIDTSGPADILACAFEGATSSGGEYASANTTITLKATSKKPLAFDVARATLARSTQPHPGSSQTSHAVEHFEIGAPSCTKAAPAP